MPRAYFDVSLELFVEICKGLKPGDDDRYYRVKDNPLPEDASVVSAVTHYQNGKPRIRITIESLHVSDGQALPAVMLESVRS